MLRSEERYRVKFLSQNQKYLIRKYVIQPAVALATILSPLSFRMIPKALTKLERPIFVVGCSRSGTTLFLDMFSQHPDLANWTEAGQVFELNYYGKNIDHHKLAADLNMWNGSRIKILLGLYTHIKRKNRLVNKLPENSVRIHFLKALFPDAMFIHVIRDGRAVVRSSYSATLSDSVRAKFPLGQFVKSAAWRQHLSLPLLQQFAYQWAEVVEYVREASRQLSSQEYREVTYEDFCENPRKILAEVDCFCGLDTKFRNIESIPVRFDSFNVKWQHDFNEEQMQAIMPIMQDTLQKFGYLDEQ